MKPHPIKTQQEFINAFSGVTEPMRLAKISPREQEPSLFCSVVAFGFGCALIWLLSLVVMLTWNIVVPPIFGLPPLSYMQAVALLVLVSIFKYTPKDGPMKAARVVTGEDKVHE